MVPHYNAFISYRHHPEDIKVAETIHRALERFKVPKALKKQGKSIDRIFRDKEELPITSSLTDTITSALRNSDYQIVICSTHLKDSYWVQREIDTFLQTHTKDKVLTVLVDGDNPYDVIPEILQYNEYTHPETGEVIREPIEPLSCDWRLPKRKAMKTELPRLAAVLLGCSYDDLIQRQKQYRQRRLIAGVSTGMAASLALAGYFLYTSIQIQENYEQALRNQSQFLASASMEKFNEGDRLTALALAMEALPNQDNDRPFVAAAAQALTEALMLYEAEGNLISVASFNTESTVEAFVVSDDGKTLYALDSQNFVSVWDTITHEKLAGFNILGYPLLEPALLTDNNSNFLTIGGADKETLLCYTREGTLLWQMDSIESIAFCEGKNALLAIRTVREGVYDAVSHYELLQIRPDTGELTAEPYTLFSFDEMGSPAFAADTYYEQQPIALTGYKNSLQHIVISNPLSQASESILSHDALFYGASVSEDNRLYALVTENDDMSNVRWGNFYSNTKAHAFLYCFDMDSGKQLWCTKITAYNYSEANTVAPIQGTDRLFCQYGSAFLQVDAKTGKILEECHSTNIPLTIDLRETGAWVLFNNGCAGTYTYATNTLGYIQYMENGLLMGHNNQGIYVVPQLSSNILLYRTTSDDSYTAFTGEYDDYIGEMVLWGDYMATTAVYDFHMFDLAQQRLLWSIDKDFSDMLGFSADGSILYARKYSGIRAYDTRTGDLIWTRDLPYAADNYAITMYYDAIKYADDEVCCMVYDIETGDPYIFFYDLITEEYATLPFGIEENIKEATAAGGTPVILHLDEACALVSIGSGNLSRFDRTTGEAAVLFSDIFADPAFLADLENNRMVFSTAEGIAVTDAAGQLIVSIPLTEAFAVSFYFYGDELLCLSSDGTVCRYDMEGNLLSTTALSIYSDFFSKTKYMGSENIPVTWAVTPDNEVVVNVFRMGNIIDTNSWERTCDLPHLVTYHEGKDCFVAQANDMIYAYTRRSLGETLVLAQEELGTFVLTDEQREYYGLN